MQLAEQKVTPLPSLKPGQSGTIASISTSDKKRLQKLMAMGVLPGLRISLLQRFPSYVFRVGHSQFAVDEDIAMAIHVRLSKSMI